MPDKINGMGGPGVQPSRTTGANETRADRREGSQPSAAPGADNVQLTESARLLQRLETELRTAPEVDQSRVAEVKERLAEGRFDIDPHRIAKRLVKTEQDL